MSNSNLYYDGIGVVNNRGASKYWGVSPKNSEENIWNVSITNNNHKTNLKFASNIQQSEELAAKIAAHVYQFRDSITLPAFVNVWVDSQIYHVDFYKKTITKNSNSHVCTLIQLDLSGIKSIDPEVKEDESEEMIDLSLDRFELPVYDKELIEEVFGALINDELTERGQTVLKKIVEVLS